MVTFRNNNRRNNFRRSDRNFKSTNERNKFGSSSFNSKENFTRKINVKNNHNISKLIEKYSNLAREALSNGDKILSENYFQHADHFIRISDQKNTEKEYKSIYTKLTYVRNTGPSTNKSSIGSIHLNGISHDTTFNPGATPALDNNDIRLTSCFKEPCTDAENNLSTVIDID